VLGEAMSKGFGGVMIGTLPNGIGGGNLDHPSLDPFWDTASKLGAAVYLHPMFICGEPRLSDYDLVNTLGRLVDTSIAVSRLLYSGHLLKFTGMKFARTPRARPSGLAGQGCRSASRLRNAVL
jgi:aminocarboxymuconate-semialdehyde decarboxylase